MDYLVFHNLQRYYLNIFKQVYFQKYTIVYSYMTKIDSWWHAINHEEVFWETKQF